MDDDELLELLAAGLDPGTRTPPPERVAELRARVAANEHRADATASVDGALVRAAPVPRTGRPRPARRTRPARLLVAAAAALVVFVGGVLAGRATEDRPAGEGSGGSEAAAGVVEFDGPLRGPDGEVGAELVVRRTGTGRVVTFESDTLPVLPRGEFYELWFVGPDDTPAEPDRISAGTFHPDDQGRSSVQFSGAFDPALYPRISVTLEPGDGDPARTGPEVLAG